jgi:hypothetical protein
MDLTFHIIYTRGTVRSLLGFVTSLLRWSNARFRLVANGCKDEELKLLQAFCSQNERTEWLSLSAEERLQHGDALEKLARQESSPFFCFMDSDILASGYFLDRFQPLLNAYSALFSGRPVWNTPQDSILPENMPLLDGRYLFTKEGLCLGSTYFAIYHRATLLEILDETGVSLHWTNWNGIPAHIQERLQAMQMQMTWYDTTRILLLFYHQKNLPIKYVEENHLHHLGGVSWTTIANKLAQEAPDGSHRHSRLKLPPLHQLDLRRASDGTAAPISADEKNQLEQAFNFWNGRDRAKNNAEYFGALLLALQSGLPLPPLQNQSDPQTAQKILAATQAILDIYPDYLAWLARVGENNTPR